MDLKPDNSVSSAYVRAVRAEDFLCPSGDASVMNGDGWRKVQVGERA